MNHAGNHTQEKHASKWHKFNRVKDRPDHRDMMFTAPAPISVSYPSHISLRAGMGPVKDQGNVNGCTGYASAAAMLYVASKIQNIAVTDFSEFFAYYNGRKLENATLQDQGEQIRDTIKGLGQWGICENKLWPDDPAMVLREPSLEAYNNAALYKATAYRRVNLTEADIQAALVSGYPIIAGIAVYDSFETDQVTKTGIVPVPQQNEKFLGGHAILFTGYDFSDPNNKTIEFRNSWSSNWGNGGYGTLPLSFVLNPNLNEDMWVIVKVEQAA